MNKPVYLGTLILGTSKKLICRFWYDYIKLKYGDRAKLWYTDTDSFVIDIKTKDFYKDIANDVEKWFDISNYEEDDKRLLPICKNKKEIGFFKDELGGKIMKVFSGLRAKTWTYLMDDYSEKKIVIGTKIRVIKRRIILENYADYSFNDKIILNSQ